eukprot:m51a1_g14821 hypothetical protein (1080) ;mRNA; r:640151-644990
MLGETTSIAPQPQSDVQVPVAPVESRLDTLDEPVWQTIWRDIRAIIVKLSQVLLPFRFKRTKSTLYDWDLWGPLFIVLLLAVLLTISAPNAQQALVFAVVFVFVWIGAAVVTLNVVLIGGKLSFFQSICLLGYCVFPLTASAFILVLLRIVINSVWIRLLVVVLGLAWSIWASYGFLVGTCPPKRIPLGVYPLFLFFSVLGWMNCYAMLGDEEELLVFDGGAAPGGILDVHPLGDDAFGFDAPVLLAVTETPPETGVSPNGVVARTAETGSGGSSSPENALMGGTVSPLSLQPPPPPAGGRKRAAEAEATPPSASESPAPAAAGASKPRKKLWKCVYPGCCESAKTHYNCHSHVWDAHVRHELAGASPEAALVYKKLPNREAVKPLLEPYMVELPDTSPPPAATPAQTPLQPQQSQQQQQQQQQPEAKRRRAQLQATPQEPLLAQYATPKPAVPARAMAQSSPDEASPGGAVHAAATTSRGYEKLPQNPAPTPTLPAPSPAAAAAVAVKQEPGLVLGLTQQQMQQQLLQQQQQMQRMLQEQALQRQRQQQQQQQQAGAVELAVLPGTAASAQQLAGVSPGQSHILGVRLEDPAYGQETNEFMRIVQLNANLKRLHVCGEVFAEHGFLQRSDARFKQDIEPIKGALQRVLQLGGKTFRYKGDPTLKMGFIAQELQQVVPEAVHRDEDGCLSVDVVGLVPMVTEALRELYGIATAASASDPRQMRDAISDAMSRINQLEAHLDRVRADSDKAAAEAARRSAESRKNKLRCELSFGPAVIVLFFTMTMACAGVVAPFLVSGIPFVWAYCWLVALVMALSLYANRAELVRFFRTHQLKLYWRPANSVNVYVLVTIGLCGTALSTVMGDDTIKVVGAFVGIMFFMWLLGLVAYKKFGVRFHTIFLVMVGYLTAGALGYAILFMTNSTFQCSLAGTDVVDGAALVKVHLNAETNPVRLSSLPWNCPYNKLRTSTSLPTNITWHHSSKMLGIKTPYFQGTTRQLFDTRKSNVYLVCADYIDFYCGSVTYQVCEERADKASCLSNGCAWCGTTDEGHCGFCTEEFSNSCYASTKTKPTVLSHPFAIK